MTFSKQKYDDIFFAKKNKIFFFERSWKLPELKRHFKVKKKYENCFFCKHNLYKYISHLYIVVISMRNVVMRIKTFYGQNRLILHFFPSDVSKTWGQSGLKFLGEIDEGLKQLKLYFIQNFFNIIWGWEVKFHSQPFEQL